MPGLKINLADVEKSYAAMTDAELAGLVERTRGKLTDEAQTILNAELGKRSLTEERLQELAPALPEQAGSNSRKKLFLKLALALALIGGAALASRLLPHSLANTALILGVALVAFLGLKRRLR